MCTLCNVLQEDKKWEEDGFFGLICCKCNVPMIVLREHRAELSGEEQETFKRLWARYYPDLMPRGIGMPSEPGHWHEHAVNELW